MAYYVRVEPQGDQAQNESEDDTCTIQFSAGNPRVEHITGVIHLYRQIDIKRNANVDSEDAYVHNVETTTLCCLAIPADMSVAEFCTFCGAYLTHMREMRVLRREGGKNKKGVCMVLVHFNGPEHAQSFLQDCNNKPFCSLEPDIVCKLVRVRSVEVFGRPLSSYSSYTDCNTTHSSSPLCSYFPHEVACPSRSQGGGETTSQREKNENASKASSSSSSCSPAGKGSRQGLHTSPMKQRPLGGRVASSFLVSGLTIPPPAGTTELPTCPVCLERLDEHISGVLTTVCNHQFHSECLQKWGDTSCPVCRYCSQPNGAEGSNCSTCNSCTDLWICLICGHIGCGRYKAGHAYDHWKGSQHCYALELETQRVWDYVGDNYVHRLIQSKTDGKLVEVPSPAQAQGAGRGSSARHGRGNSMCQGDIAHDGAEASEPHPGDEELKEAMMTSKLDYISQEYNYLLTSQLDSQRAYYEGLLHAAECNAEQRVKEAKEEASQLEATAARALELAKEADRKKQSVDKKLVDAGVAAQRLMEEKEFLRSLNDTLLSNQRDFQNQLKNAKAEVAAKEANIKDLQEQVRDLMFFLEAQKVVQTASEGNELQQGTVLPVPEQQTKRSGRSKSGRINKH
ncbi:hypothetical protein CEUSTIGMA_g8267.t1 [Chlamydomonas eustigma]|uniref:BRCA1-associated protein n=1 Tax=Chlamydomonas eustigma TaxID=1157962 RepID=A0A250XD71_9CHLO|nr:hypothetical protein CEUSTIGMA_g8267.t1 [Chlamydomonas eustigma]|eukprot:GAX80832.1 hypothetical protein CEUSTIGMA_g8267.t1 [Chlamydomonas eustigma]